MTPLRRLELRLLRECALASVGAKYRHARFLDDIDWPRGHGSFVACVERAWEMFEGDMARLASLAAEYRDLRDARRMLDHFAENAGICEVCGLHCRYDGHAPGCALERVTR